MEGSLQRMNIGRGRVPTKPGSESDDIQRFRLQGSQRPVIRATGNGKVYHPSLRPGQGGRFLKKELVPGKINKLLVIDKAQDKYVITHIIMELSSGGVQPRTISCGLLDINETFLGVGKVETTLLTESLKASPFSEKALTQTE